MSTFSNTSSEITGPIKVKFHLEPPWDGGMKIYSTDKMATMPMVKTIKNLLLNQKANELETLYAASGARVLPNLFK